MSLCKILPIVLCVLVFVPKSFAIVLTFSGIIDSTSAAFSSRLPQGATFELEYTIPEPTIPIFSSPGFNNTYEGAVQLSASSGFEAGQSSAEIVVANDSFDFGGSDALLNGVSATLVSPEGMPGEALYFRFRLMDNESSALISDDINQPITFADFDTRTIEFFVDEFGPSVAGTLTGLSTVPEPSVAFLMISSLGIALRRKRN